MGENDGSRSLGPGVPAGLEALSFGDGDDEQVVLVVPLPEWELPAVLTAAEREVARAVLDGRSAGEIARQRGTSVRTVANQVQSIYQKLGVGSRVELAARCVRATSKP